MELVLKEPILTLFFIAVTSMAVFTIYHALVRGETRDEI